MNYDQASIRQQLDFPIARRLFDMWSNFAELYEFDPRAGIAQLTVLAAYCKQLPTLGTHPLSPAISLGVLLGEEASPPLRGAGTVRAGYDEPTRRSAGLGRSGGRTFRTFATTMARSLPTTRANQHAEASRPGKRGKQSRT